MLLKKNGIVMPQRYVKICKKSIRNACKMASRIDFYGICRDFRLLGYKKEILLLAFLHEDVLAGEEHVGSGGEVDVGYFLLVD